LENFVDFKKKSKKIFILICTLDGEGCETKKLNLFLNRLSLMIRPSLYSRFK